MVRNFKDVKGFEGLYEINEDSLVVNKKRKKLVKVNISMTGYVKMKLHKNGKRHYFLLHRLVALNFIPNPDNKPQVNHINGNKLDNRVENLEWVTDKENKQHASKLGLLRTKKIPNELVAEIKFKYSSGNYTHKMLAKEYNTALSNIWWVLHKR